MEKDQIIPVCRETKEVLDHTNRDGGFGRTPTPMDVKSAKQMKTGH